MIAANAQKIIDMRMQGFKPDEAIIVSLVGRISEPNHTVIADPAKKYDWRWVRNLVMGVYVGAKPNWYDAVKAIAMARPEYLYLWNMADKWGSKVYLIPTAEDVTKPVRLWTYELDFLPWLEFENTEYIECK
jgi:hypothetical protein